MRKPLNSMIAGGEAQTSCTPGAKSCQGLQGGCFPPDADQRRQFTDQPDKKRLFAPDGRPAVCGDTAVRGRLTSRAPADDGRWNGFGGYGMGDAGRSETTGY